MEEKMQKMSKRKTQYNRIASGAKSIARILVHRLHFGKAEYRYATFFFFSFFLYLFVC